MSSATVALDVVVVVFAGGVVGVSLQHALPEKYTTGGTRDLIERVVGLLTVLTTLVLGLMIWTAYGVYSSQNAAVQSFAQRVVQEDMALADYGPDAAAARKDPRGSEAQPRPDVGRPQRKRGLRFSQLSCGNRELSHRPGLPGFASTID